LLFAFEVIPILSYSDGDYEGVGVVIGGGDGGNI
jgi:hypothetical protein